TELLRSADAQMSRHAPAHARSPGSRSGAQTYWPDSRSIRLHPGGSLRPCEGPTQPSSRSCAYKCRKISSASPRQVTRNRRTTDRRPGEVSTRYRKLVLAEGDDILELRQAARNSCSTSRR